VSIIQSRFSFSQKPLAKIAK